MRRGTLTVLALLSAAACVAAALAWVHSYRRAPVRVDATKQRWFAQSWRGQLAVVHCRARPVPPTLLRLELHARSSTGVYVFGIATVFGRQPGGLFGTPTYGVVQRPVYLMSITDGAKPKNGFGFAARTHAADVNGTRIVSAQSVAVPHWFVMASSGALAWRLWRRRVRRPAGHCAACGYDLRATPQRCPECGAEAPAPAATALPRRLV